MAGSNGRLAMLQRMRENGSRRGDDGGGRYENRNAYTSDYPNHMTYEPPYGSPDMRRRYETRGGYDGDMPMDRRMGFEQPMDAYDTEMRRRRRKDGTFMHYGGERESQGMEPIRFGGMVAMDGGGHRGTHQKMTREMAEDWVNSMEGSDPAKQHGGKWTTEQIKPIAQKYGVPTEGDRFWEFYAVMNAMYSDYYPVAKKYNVLTPDFFADLAMAFISDKDAVENKAAVYYDCLVEH
jgi:hypothetical protein